ncbi:MAG TPA: hypothetical protein VGE39_08300 [Prosthecobacter sp.]
MKKLNPYLQQLHMAIDSTRTGLLTELQQVQAARTNALSARDYAASDKWAAYKEMGLNEQVLTVASRIEEMAARTQLLARNLTLFANESEADAVQAQGAMAEAATAIKNAVAAMEVLTRGVHDAASVTKSKDAEDHVNVQALAASKAVEDCVTAVDDLQTQSLKSSIIAAKPLAGSVAQSFSVLGDQVMSLITDTTQARDVARQEVAATTANRNRTWSRYYTQIPPLERQLQSRSGLMKSFGEIDRLANNGLKVSIANQKPQKSSQDPSIPQQDQDGLVPGLLAEATLPPDDAGRYHAPVFCAVKELDAPTFAFGASSNWVEGEAKSDLKGTGTPATKQASKDAKPAADTSATLATATGGAFQALLQHDHKGDPIMFGESYRIFMRQDVAGESSDAGVMNGVRESLPSQPITASFTFEKNPSAPMFVRLRCDAADGPADPLLVAFTLPTAPPHNVSHRMIIVPSRLWNTHLEDEQFLIERANPAAYAKLDFSRLSPANKKEIEPIVDGIIERFVADLKVLLPIGDQENAKKEAHHAVKEALHQIGSHALSRTALVYFSPVDAQPPAAGQKPGASPTVSGDYLDMYGSLIDLTKDSYRVGVLAWLDDPKAATATVSALVGESKVIGVRTPHYDGSGPEEPGPAPAAAAATATPSA